MESNHYLLMVPLLFTVILQIFIIDPSLASTANVKREKVQINDEIAFVLVYGSDSAKMNASDAETYCEDLAKEMNVTAPAVVDGHLAAIHDPMIIRTVMDFVLSKMQQQFHIGGLITKVVHEGRDNIIIRWRDHSEDDFRFLYQPEEILREMAPLETRCLTVDYVTGRWGVHSCEKKMYFLCQIRVIDPEAMLREPHRRQVRSDSMV